MDTNNEQITDLGATSAVINIRKDTLTNTYYRRTLWTGEHLQVTIMCIPPGGEIGLEVHPNIDQFIRIQSGVASVYMGQSKQDVKFFQNANYDYAVIIPAGTWHNLINNQRIPLKFYSIYAPPQHPKGTTHKTKLDADLAGD